MVLARHKVTRQFVALKVIFLHNPEADDEALASLLACANSQPWELVHIYSVSQQALCDSASMSGIGCIASGLQIHPYIASLDPAPLRSLTSSLPTWQPRQSRYWPPPATHGEPRECLPHRTQRVGVPAGAGQPAHRQVLRHRGRRTAAGALESLLCSVRTSRRGSLQNHVGSQPSRPVMTSSHSHRLGPAADFDAAAQCGTVAILLLLWICAGTWRSNHAPAAGGRGECRSPRACRSWCWST